MIAAVPIAAVPIAAGEASAAPSGLSVVAVATASIIWQSSASVSVSLGSAPADVSVTVAASSTLLLSPQAAVSVTVVSGPTVTLSAAAVTTLGLTPVAAVSAMVAQAQMPATLSTVRTISITPMGPVGVYGPEPQPIVFRQDVAAVLDYTIDWAPMLADVEDEIVASSIALPANGLLQLASAATATRLSVLLAALAPETYAVGFKILTRDGRADERTILFEIREM